MKSKLFKLISGLGVFAFALSVNAEVTDTTTIDLTGEGQTSSNAVATVGTVETPVYEVAVIWNDLTFDWVYDEEKEEFGWAPTTVCSGIGFDEEYIESAIARGEELFVNDTCSERIYEYNPDARGYYVLSERKTATIGIEDMSQKGQIIPSISWEADEKYADVDADFSYTGEGCVLLPTDAAFNYAKENGHKIYNENTCETEASVDVFATDSYYVNAVTSFDLPSTGELPDNGRISGAGTAGVDGVTLPPIGFNKNYYFVHLALEGGETTPEEGDTIGTITVSISVK